jgi:hypothetical protein
MELTKEEIQIIIQILESVSIQVKQAEDIIIPILSKLRKMLEEEE